MLNQDAEEGRVVLLIGTQKGLFRLTSDSARQQWDIEGPYIAGYEILHAWNDPRDPRIAYAAALHTVWGAHIYRSEDGGRSWHSLSTAPQHPPGLHDQRLRAIWYLAPAASDTPNTLYAGIDPAGLFVSHDRGGHWQPIRALNEHPTRGTWEPAKGGFSLHSIQQPEGASNRLYAAISAGGVYRSDDRGASWYPINRNVRAEHLPQRYPVSGHNVHRLVAHPTRPDRLYRQCYNGLYRSDDGGLDWSEITEGLPSDFGYAVACERDDPDAVYVVPIAGNHMRTTPDGRLRVYRSGDAGRSWQALTDGLPQSHVYVTVLREAMALDQLPDCGIYVGTSSGHLFASPNRGRRWHCIAEFLPRILSVSAVVTYGDF